MKTNALIFKNNSMNLLKLLYPFLFFILGNVLHAQDKEFKIKYPNGLVYQEGKLITNLQCGPVIQITTYDFKGRIIKKEDFQKGNRCGPTKVYDNETLIKDIVFKNNLMESYIYYIDGKVNCQISADRNKIIHNGKTVDIRWSKFYHVIDDKKFMFFDKKSFVDIFRKFMVPEDLTQALADISALYDGKDVSGKNAVVGGCGSKVAVINDLGADFKSTDAAGQKKSADAGAAVLNACSSSRNADLTAPFNGKTGDAARAGRIDKARSMLDQAIENCGSNGSNLNSGGLVSMDPFSGGATMVNLVYDAATSGEAVAEVIQSGEALEATAAGFESAGAAGMHSSLPVRLAKAAETTMKVFRPLAAAVSNSTAGATAGAAGTTTGATAGAAGTTAGAAGTTAGAAGTTAGTTVGAGVATTVAAAGLVIVGAVLVGAILYEGVKSYEAGKEAEASDAVGAQADAALKELRAQQKALEDANRSAKNANPPPKTGGGKSTPMPPGMGSENGCERLKRFKQYCDDNGWKTSDCEDAARLWGGCKGDIREMYVAGDGNVSSVGCPQTLSAEDLARKECAKRGMIASTISGGTFCKSKGGIQPSLPPVVDPNVVNPARGDFSTVFNNTSVKVMGSSTELSSNLKSSTKKTMVVFMDPDCPSCKTMSYTLKSPEVQSAAANVNILVIDGTLAPEVIRDYKISAYPSTMLISNGKVSPMTIGSMSSNEAINFMKAD